MANDWWKVSYRGILGTGEGTEIWTFSLNFGFPSVSTLTSNLDATIATALLDRAQAFIQATNMNFMSHVGLGEVRTYVMDGDTRKVKAGTAVTVVEQEPIRGPSSSPVVPWQISNVVTLRSTSERPVTYGRIYLPPQSFQITTEGLVPASQRDTWLPLVEDFIADSRDAVTTSPGLEVIIPSQRAANSIYGWRRVESVGMGLVTDTQRRRRGELAESRTFLPLV